MDIHLMGTGGIFTDAMSSFAIVDGNLLLDCPNGAVKTLRRASYDIKQINTCLITHFHGDHILDIPFLLMEEGLLSQRQAPFYMIGPRDIRDRVKDLLDISYNNLWEKVSEKAMLKVLEIDKSSSTFSIDGFDIHAFPVIHEVGEPSYGYTVASGGKVLGFTGDATICDGVEEILKASDMTICDMSFELCTATHMGVDTILEYQKQYGDRIIPTHMSDGAREAYKNAGKVPPKDGSMFYL